MRNSASRFKICLTRNSPQIRLWCPRPKSNMYDFSVLSGSYVHVEATQEKELNSLHALKGILKEGKKVTLSITYIKRSFLHKLAIASIAQSAEQQSMDCKVPGSSSGLRQSFFFHYFIIFLASL